MASNLDEWYQKLSSRRVDLVGDYAGTELFLIEGDALLLEAFSDPKLDFRGQSLQLLHATYTVELFLKRLSDRNCHFEIIFFDDHELLSIPPTSDPKDAYKYLLARAAIIRHLDKNVVGDFPVRHFSSISHPSFLQYLHDAGVYFIMGHDGAGCDSEVKAAFRYALRWWIGHGWNVALLNTVETLDTKAMTVVMEGRRDTEMPAKQPLTRRVEGSASLDLETLDIVKVNQCFEAQGVDPSEREVLALACISLLARSELLQADDITTLLLHSVALRHISLARRRLEPSNDTTADTETGPRLLQSFSHGLYQLLQNSDLIKTFDSYKSTCNVADVVDGRLLDVLQAAQATSPVTLSAAACADLESFQVILSDLVQPELSTAIKQRISAVTTDRKDQTDPSVKAGSTDVSFPVLPFSHPIFNTHLAPVHLEVDPEGDPTLSLTEDRIFQELSHWHNAKRPLTTKGNQVQAPDWKARRRNDRFMAEMLKYSASLTNAAGNVLDPETIIVRTSAAAPPAKKQPHQAAEKPAASKAKAGTGGKKVGGRAAALEAAAKVQAGKAETKDAQYFSAWDSTYKDFAKLSEAEERYLRADKYLMGLTKSARGAVEAEIQLYKAVCLYELYEKAVAAQKSKGPSSATDQAPRTSTESYVALIWAIGLRLRGININVPKNISTALNSILQRLSLPSILKEDSTNPGRKLNFKVDSSTNSSKKSSVESTRDPQRFQLEYCGPYFDRSFDATTDARVYGFEPDRWQRDVLDTIDAKKSLLVLAPTSAGKTFISFYAMKQVLESSDDGVLVYVAPTKALVNQIAAEVQARFSKNLKHGGRSVWGIHTRDYRINNPTGCQVLVTVPQILQIMLLAPSNAEKQSSWSNRVSRIIFDEVHSIGQAEDGLIWEQLILLAPCPIIALSATVGNPDALGSWMGATQRALGNDFVTIQHKTRYSDLRKFNYQPPKEFAFKPLNQPSSINVPGLDGSDAFTFVHPVSSLVHESRGIPEDLNLEARDCLMLYEAMSRHQTGDYKVSSDLSPSKVIPAIVRKVDILKWENALKQVLKQWMKATDSPFTAVVEDLSKPTALASNRKAAGGDNGMLLQTTLPLLVDLHEKDALPAILFNFDRSKCEDIAQDVLAKLKQSEEEWKSTNVAWKKKLATWQEWKDNQDKENEKAKKASSKDKKKQKSNDRDEEGGGKSEQMRNAANQQSTWMSTFDPNAPVEGFHFANWKTLLPSELVEYQKELSYRGVSPWLIEALARGVGVHHAGMNRKYRQVVEMLFRKGFLRVVVATGTLALGINMPCKTVVFSGDSVFLTALNFRQSAGRAGRRGFDVLGNVVFQNIPYDKVCRLLSSRLPDLNGHFPITTSLVLRLFTLLHATNNGSYASRAVNALLSQPRLYLGGEEAKMTVLHHLRFSIDYLRRTSLLGQDGEPLNLAGLVSHLYYTENSGFAFHALLKGGYFHNLCAGIDKNPKAVLLELMLTLSHLFNRIPCKRSDEEFVEDIVKRSSSKVFLDPMPKLAEGILKQHNSETLHMYCAYVATYIQQYVSEPEHELPLSHLPVGGDADRTDIELNGALPPVTIRSPFVALSGHGDEFTTIHDLCSTVRGGVFLEENVIPHVALYPQESDLPLNAYLLDFFKHGSLHDLDIANGIRVGNIWFVLNDFSLVLATIIASLENFMKLTPTEADGLEVRGSGDVAEEQADVTQVGDSGYATAENSVAEESDGDADLIEGIASASLDDGKGLIKVLKAFKMLQTEFNVKFKKTWA